MISGPDLGGGFLHQLSVEGSTAPDSQFVFHTQVGAEDAGGPPKGSPEPLGYRHPGSACQFGGPRCWHRTFLLPRTDALRVRTAYNRMRFVMAALMDQLYAGTEIPIEDALRELGRTVLPALDSNGIPYRIVGEGAVWLRSAGPRPNGLEIHTPEEGVRRASEILSEYVIEPAARTEGGAGSWAFASTAFLGTLKAGTRIRFCSSDPTDVGTPSSGSATGPRSARIRWEGLDLVIEEPPSPAGPPLP
ncbi:MAG: hypothetical protein WA761_05285 [Thermoplasmata archaeon]